MSKQLVMKLPLEQINILKKLGSYPELQMECFEKVLNEDYNKGLDRVDDDGKLLYLQLKCRQDPDMVTFSLERYNMPLDRSLQVCEKHDNHFGVAYLKFRLGIKEEAVEQYLKVSSLTNSDHQLLLPKILEERNAGKIQVHF